MTSRQVALTTCRGSYPQGLRRSITLAGSHLRREYKLACSHLGVTVLRGGFELRPEPSAEVPRLASAFFPPCIAGRTDSRRPRRGRPSASYYAMRKGLQSTAS